MTQKSVSEVEFQRDGEPGSNLSPRAALARRQDWDLGLVECGTAAGQSQSIPDVPITILTHRGWV